LTYVPAHGKPAFRLLKTCVGSWKFESFKLDSEAIEVADTLIYNYDGKPFRASRPAKPMRP